MKVALLHDYLNQAGGAERVLLALAELFPDAPIHTLIHDKKRLLGFENKNIKTSFLQKMPFSSSHIRWYLPLMPSAIEQLDLSGHDIVISSTSALIKGVITHPQTLHICYCHTPTRYLWSEAHQYHKEIKEGKIVKNFLPYILNNLRLWDQVAAQRVNYFIANSNFIAQRIKNYYNRESAVIYPPVDTENFYTSNELGDYYLIISRLKPYKKVNLAIQAFNKLNIPLKIIGIGEEEKKLKKMAKPNIEFLGAVSEEEKRSYLSRCLALIHPQTEDFGITAVEAMASGRPVIAYAEGGSLETVVNGESGIFFNEQSWEALIDTVIKFKPQEFDPHAIKNHAEKFNSKNFYQQIKNFVDKSYQKFKNNNNT
ncbi:MAG TPA: glycosyltransferase family 4 protein [Candidatus Uhrbacteria bacterium]|nr:glycosyltransferase family 4 protein [Candidatus Uhrbacteria bacterium]